MDKKYASTNSCKNIAELVSFFASMVFAIGKLFDSLKGK